MTQTTLNKWFCFDETWPHFKPKIRQTKLTEFLNSKGESNDSK